MMFRTWRLTGLSVLLGALVVLASCAPAASPSPPSKDIGAPAAKDAPAPAKEQAAPSKPGESGKPAEAAKPSGKPAQELSVRVGLSGIASAIYAPVHAAQERGLYAKYGVKAELTDFSSGSATQEALAAGEADIIHYFPPGIATAVSKGVKEKIIASDQFRPTDWHIVVTASSNIRLPEDLNDKKIAVTAKGSTTDFFALWFAQKAGVNAQIVPLGSPANYAAVAAGNIDAAVITPPLVYQGIEKNEVRSIFNFETEMPPNLPSALAASDKLITEQPEAVTRYLKAVFESIRYMKQNLDYCTSFVAKHTNQEPSIAERTCKNIVARLSDDGHIQPEWLDNSLSLAKLGGLTDLPPQEQFFTDKFTPVKLD